MCCSICCNRSMALRSASEPCDAWLIDGLGGGGLGRSACIPTWVAVVTSTSLSGNTVCVGPAITVSVFGNAVARTSGKICAVTVPSLLCFVDAHVRCVVVGVSTVWVVLVKRFGPFIPDVALILHIRNDRGQPLVACDLEYCTRRRPIGNEVDVVVNTFTCL